MHLLMNCNEKLQHFLKGFKEAKMSSPHPLRNFAIPDGDGDLALLQVCVCGAKVGTFCATPERSIETNPSFVQLGDPGPLALSRAFGAN